MILGVIVTPKELVQFPYLDPLAQSGSAHEGALLQSPPKRYAFVFDNEAYLVVIVLVPIAFRVPATLVFLPPLMPLTPATLPRIVQFTALVICQPAVASVSPDCLVEFMVCVSNSALTLVEVFCLKARHYGAK